ncbi:DUF418 domain-containing protein [Dyadobacter sp. CY323]|uniref:DUF418 domain-containing protein n=1 Tax=Dyadobacter sp. CY323 TaxID=2907302 RepID=UPI001F32EE60|nr:DUF418 domain-containing protein [Dyadobacter sp. CY323]MCE6991306.1 DUF418 domain-containing protein [Dyadobacter sp. CY323]
MTTSTLVQSVRSVERIHVLDAVRGFALLGILLMNIPYFALPEETVSNLNIRNEYSGPNFYAWWIITMFFEGSMRGLFSMMFGAGMVLLTTRLSKNMHIDSAAEIYYRRLIWMLLFGLIDAYIILWPGDILYSYAVCGLFLFPLRNIKPRHLFVIAGILMLFFVAKISYQRHEPLRNKIAAEAILKKKLPPGKQTLAQKEIVDKWKGFQERQKLENKKKQVTAEIRKTKGTYATLWSHYADVNTYLESSDFYQSGFLDCLIFMIIGIAFYQLKIITGERTQNFYLLFALAGYAVALPLIYFQIKTSVSVRFDVIKYLERIPIQTYEIRRLGLTIGHLGMLMLLYKSGFFSWIFNIWAKVGQMAFSNYLLQNITCGLIFYGFGFNYFNELDRYQLYLIVPCVWTLNIVFSYIWLRFFSIGPFEWIWRSLTYWNVQPIRKKDKVLVH